MNVIGPLDHKREPNEEWDEIICNKKLLYYYFKKGTYFTFIGEYISYQELEWYQIGTVNYMVEIGDVNFCILNEGSNFNEIITEICCEAAKEDFDVNIPVDFDKIKSFKEVFEILIQSPKELFILIEYVINKINLKIITKQLNKDEITNEFIELLDVFKFIKFETRFEIVKDIIYMLSEGSNIGPIKYQIPVNDKWNEVNNEGLYYYFRK
jgi:hypothetical protein